MITLQRLCLGTTLTFGAAWVASACGPYGGFMTLQAVSADPEAADVAITALRAEGPEGLAKLLRVHGGAVNAFKKSLDYPGSPVPAGWDRIARALDSVGAQKDNFAAGLFWHTDLAEAKMRAAAEGKPILSLRLLGRLDEDRSCANSRFFRTVLYADDSIAEVLRERFILHWQSVRPVPYITIEMGDGRRIERTITGNSLHYALDTHGRVLDANPGLCEPATFREWLATIERLHDNVSENPQRRDRILETHHNQSGVDLVRRWKTDERVGSVGGPVVIRMVDPADKPIAVAAAPLAVSKAAIEVPMLSAMWPQAVRLERASDEMAWQQIADSRLGGRRLSRGSLRLMALKSPGGTLDPETLDAFERIIARDTIRNDYLMHLRVHRWLAERPNPAVDDLTGRIYAELFNTPLDDPWMGMAPADAYAALDGGGLVTP